MKMLLATILTVALVAPAAVAQEAKQAPTQVLFTNVNIFDGVNEGRMAGNVLVEGNLIKQV